MTPDILVEQAADRLRGFTVRTPYEQSPGLSQFLGTAVWTKGEHRQHTGSFKLRGAFNKLLGLSDADRKRGVVAASSGNHGAAVAYACAALNIAGKVYVPEGASSAKLKKIRDQGAEVVLFGSDGLDTEIEARRMAEVLGATYVSPYNDPDVVAGQGTVALEMLQTGPTPDVVYVAVGGGGLIGGIARYLADIAPATRIVGALPANSPVMAESVKAGRIVEMPWLATLSDGTAGGIEPGAITFDICRQFVHEWVTVTEGEIAEAMRLWARGSDEPIEGAAAVAIAALLRDAGRLHDVRVAVVICGGNVSREVWQGVVGGSR